MNRRLTVVVAAAAAGGWYTKSYSFSSFSGFLPVIFVVKGTVF